MRLLHTTTYALEEFLGDEIPRYAILSHTWEGKEVTLRDMLQSNALEHLENPPSAAWEKIKNACKQARRDLWDYIWIDTCCIDKSSSAELQEAINSMFQWYAEAEMCYAFLSDLGPRLEHGPGKWKRPNVTKHRWFNRGWTLQELLAPADVYFFDCTWTLRTNRTEQANYIMKAANIKNSLVVRRQNGALQGYIEFCGK